MFLQDSLHWFDDDWFDEDKVKEWFGKRKREEQSDDESAVPPVLPWKDPSDEVTLPTVSSLDSLDNLLQETRKKLDAQPSTSTQDFHGVQSDQPQPSTSTQNDEPQPSTSSAGNFSSNAPVDNSEGVPQPAEPTDFVIHRPLEQNYFVLEIVRSKFFKDPRYIKEITFSATPKYPANSRNLEDLLPQLYVLFEHILSEVRRDFSDPNDVGNLHIDHPGLSSCIHIPPKLLALFSAQDIVDYIEYVLHSAEKIQADRQLTIKFAVAHPTLRGNGRLSIVNVERDLKKKKSVVLIRNKDNACLPRAIVVGKASLELNKLKKKQKEL